MSYCDQCAKLIDQLSAEIIKREQALDMVEEYRKRLKMTEENRYKFMVDRYERRILELEQQRNDALTKLSSHSPQDSE